ncbi:MAG: histidine kinase, partial [Hungatella sp.]
TYDIPYQMKYQDEIGHLNMAINSMYATITRQFESLKQSERAKYRSEIQLLSEQINPHFLYNTLECINMEVLSGHKEAASSMITSLGDFLRIGLSYGNDIIPLSKELTHVKAYIDIMNHRFSRKIELTYSIQPELDNLYILKSILQPLAENSIRHGFDTDEHPCDSIVMPEITMSVYQKESLICLEVSDNGCGIDIEKANASLTPPPSGEGQKQHVGLHNIYQRLTTYYGNVSITFETIPYYKNTVRITLPKKG